VEALIGLLLSHVTYCLPGIMYSIYLGIEEQDPESTNFVYFLLSAATLCYFNHTIVRRCWLVRSIAGWSNIFFARQDVKLIPRFLSFFPFARRCNRTELTCAVCSHGTQSHYSYYSWHCRLRSLVHLEDFHVIIFMNCLCAHWGIPQWYLRAHNTGI